MGGHQATRKSFAQVQEDLRRDLLANARSLLSSYGIWMSEYSAIEDVLQRIASEQFKRSYGYDYSNSSYQIRPPKSTGDNRPIDKMCNISTPIWNQVTDYLKAGVFSKLDLPRWMEQQAIAELCRKANDLVQWDTYRQWRHSEYSQTFDAKVEDTDSFICNSVLIYVNGSLTEDGITASSCIIYYSGVYYRTESPTSELRRYIQNRAYDASTSLYSVRL
ncbi:hypothetical protein P691DRAFT_148565 [Macrolepiota fuliginosa MF-IS2]|uniref:Uncharacterized protein n=1 Tax=Macrolepiota fuliginosa MF-IS2 TaxID=1400762 RepID=A0A9P5XPG0_9AGAR|nr:hypothetical protein P691DRAFT_148565 [Macrolepiota fuliginosa MF-IS2]